MPFPTVNPGQWVQAGTSASAAGVIWLPDSVRTCNQIFVGSNDGWPTMPGQFGGPYYDTDNDELIYDAAGGHNDYAGNETYRLKTLTQAWDRPHNGTSAGVPGTIIPDKASASTASYVDSGGVFGPAGTRYPASTHRYSGSCYMRLRGTGFHLGGSIWSFGDSSQEAWTYNHHAATLGTAWNRIIASFGFVMPLACSTCYDTQLDVVYAYNRNVVLTINPGTGGFGILSVDSGQTSGNANADGTLLFDPKRRRVVIIGPEEASAGGVLLGTGHPGISYLDLFKAGTLTWNNLAISGATEIASAGSLGGIYDEVRDRYVYYTAAGGHPASVYFVDPDTGTITREDGTGTTPPAGNIPNGPYGNFFRSVTNDAYGLVTSFTAAPFYFRPATLSTRVFSLANGVWTGQAMPTTAGNKLVGGSSTGTKHTPVFSDESRGLIVIGGGDVPTPGPNDSDPQTDTYNIATGTYTAAYPRCSLTTGFMVNRPDNVVFGHDTDHDLYLMGMGFYASNPMTSPTDPTGLDVICPTGHATPTYISNNLSVLNPNTSQWSNGTAWSAFAGIGGDSNACGNGDYDPLGHRLYSPWADSLVWFDTNAQTWGRSILTNVPGAASNGIHRQHVIVDVYGRKAYIIDPTVGRLAYMSINLLDGTFGQNGYVTTSTIPGFIAPLRSDLNLAPHFDRLNRVLLVNVWHDNQAFSGCILQSSLYYVDTDVWVNVPLTSTNFPGGESAGTFVQGSVTTYDKAHNAFVTFSGNNSGLFPVSGNAIPPPTQFALYRVWGGPGTAVPTAQLPNVTSLSPQSCLPGASTFLLGVFGTGFTADAVVNWAGAPLTGTTFINSGQVTVPIPASLVTTVGPFLVTVTNSVGTGSSRTFNVTFGPATLSLVYNDKIRDRVGMGDTALAPDGQLDGVVTATLNGNGGPRTITALKMVPNVGVGNEWNTTLGDGKWVLGTALTFDSAYLNNAVTMAVNFTVADGGTFVVIGSDAVTPTYFNPGTTLTLTATLSDGTTAVGAVTIGSGNPIPTLTSLDPAVGYQGNPAFILNVYGTNFVATAAVQVNGGARATTFVTSGIVQATILATDLLVLGAKSITVVNPAPGGGSSNALTFTVLPVTQAGTFVGTVM